MTVASTPVSRAQAWRDKGLPREAVAAKLAAEGLDANSVGIVLANVFPAPADPTPTPRSARGAGLLPLLAIVSLLGSGSSAVMLAAVDIRTSSFIQGLTNPVVLVGNAVSLGCCILAMILDWERARAFGFRAMGLAAVAAAPFAARVYGAAVAESVGMKGGTSGGQIIGLFGAGLTWVICTYFFAMPLVSVRMLAGGSSRR